MFQNLCVTRGTYNVPYNNTAGQTHIVRVSQRKVVQNIRNGLNSNITPLFDGTPFFRQAGSDDVVVANFNISVPAGGTSGSGTGNLNFRELQFTAPTISGTGAISQGRTALNLQGDLRSATINASITPATNTLNIQITDNASGQYEYIVTVTRQ